MGDYSAEEKQFLAELTARLNSANKELDKRVELSKPPGARDVGSPGGHWRQPQSRSIRFVPPGEMLTQYGTTWFREIPRFEAPIVEVEVSMMLGLRDVNFAARMVTGRRPKRDARVRHFRTDDLCLNGYLAAHTPTERNRHHVSIYYGQFVGVEEVELAMNSWLQPNRVTLESLAIPAGEAKE